MKQPHLDLKKIGEKIKADLPRITRQAANDSVNFFVKSFAQQGFEDEVFHRWPARRGEIRGGIARAARRSPGGRGLLIRTGDLKRSIRVKRIGSGYAVIGSDLIYAAIHNYGLEGNAWGKHKFKMPMRKFVGRSRKLNLVVLQNINKRIHLIFGKAMR